MTLTEYLNQQNPARMPRVVLEETEIVRMHKIRAGGRTIQNVFIWTGDMPKILFEYCIVDDGITLYTTDKDGNPKKPSCFSLKSNN